jgi:phosphatidylserine synthase
MWQNEKIWRILTNVWTMVFVAFLIFDFFSFNRFEYLTVPFSIIYVGVLGLYVSTKEFDRWYEMHEGRHPGELFVILWTLMIFAVLGISFFSQGEYKVSSEAIADYIMVLSVFALTQKSKRLHERKKKK